MISDKLYEKLYVLINQISAKAYRIGYDDGLKKAEKDFKKVHIDPILIRRIK